MEIFMFCQHEHHKAVKRTVPNTNRKWCNHDVIWILINCFWICYHVPPRFLNFSYALDYINLRFILSDHVLQVSQQAVRLSHCKASCAYSTNQMQGISLTCLSLAMNAFIADNERVYRWRQTYLGIEKYTFSDVYERV